MSLLFMGNTFASIGNLPVQHHALIITAVHFQTQDNFSVVRELQGVIEQVIQDLADAGDITAEPLGHR